MDMDNEGDLVDLDEDFSEDLMLGIWVIYSHHFSEVVDDEHRGDQMSVRISRSDSGYPSKMRSGDQLGVSSSTVRRPVITVVGSEVRPRPVSHVVDKDKYENEYRRFLASWNRLVRVGAVVDEENE
jgi:hypothetical protein